LHFGSREIFWVCQDGIKSESGQADEKFSYKPSRLMDPKMEWEAIPHLILKFDPTSLVSNCNHLFYMPQLAQNSFRVLCSNPNRKQLPYLVLGVSRLSRILGTHGTPAFGFPRDHKYILSQYWAFLDW
jgi:hypothetical protein